MWWIQMKFIKKMRNNWANLIRSNSWNREKIMLKRNTEPRFWTHKERWMLNLFCLKAQMIIWSWRTAIARLIILWLSIYPKMSLWILSLLLITKTFLWTWKKYSFTGAKSILRKMTNGSTLNRLTRKTETTIICWSWVCTKRLRKW